LFDSKIGVFQLPHLLKTNDTASDQNNNQQPGDDLVIDIVFADISAGWAYRKE